jgi:hypothetical protein
MKNSKYSHYIFVCISITIPLLAQNNAFLLDTNVLYIKSPLAQVSPSVVFNGNNSLVTWIDMRSSVRYHDDGIARWDIYACRVDSEGIVQDTAGIHISHYVYVVGHPVYNPGIAYGNNLCLVTYENFFDIHGARVDTNGSVLDPGGFVISDNPSLQNSSSVAFDGSNFRVAWWDNRIAPFGAVYGCRVETDGTVLDPDGILIYDSGECQSVSVAFDGTNYLVVWGTWTDVFGVRVDTAGTVLDTTAIQISTGPEWQSYASVTFGNTDYFAVWVDEAESPNADIVGARISTAGVLIDTLSIEISTMPDAEYDPAVAFDGTNYLVTWSDLATTYCARVSTGGIVIDTVPTVIAQDTIYTSSSSTVAFDGTNYLVARNTDHSDGEIYCSRIDTSGVVIDTNSILLSTSAYQGRASASAFDGVSYITVWTDSRDTSASHIYGARVDTSGVVLDPVGIDILTGKEPSIAFDGTNYLLAGSDTDIMGVRIDNTGGVLDTTTIYSIYPNRCNNPAVVFDGNDYFVAFEAWPQYGPYIYGVRVDTSGVVLDTSGIEISQGGAYDLCPKVAFDGTNYLTTFDVYGARINSMGVLIDTIPIVIASGSYRQWYPSFAFDGVNYLVVWQDNRNGYADIFGARVTPDGVVVDPAGIPICTAPSGQYKPRIEFDGQDYCVIWEDWRSGNHTDIYGCHVNPSGTVLSEFIVADQPNLQLEPTLVKGSDKYLITYTGFVDSINGRPANTLRIWGAFRELTGLKDDTQTKTQVTAFGMQTYPNPTYQKCILKYSVPTKTRINISIYDVTGRLARKVIDEIKDVGIYETTIDMASLPQGVYFIKLHSARQSRTQKITSLK